MLVGGVLLIGLAVDALAVTFRSAAPAGLPLLALYSVAAGLSGGGASWLWFLLAAAGYLLLLLAEGRDRLSQWGRVFGGRARRRAPARRARPRRAATPLAPVRTGRRIGALALGVALVVPAALPALDGGLLDGTAAATARGGGGGTISAVNPLVSLQDSLNQPEDREVAPVPHQRDGHRRTCICGSSRWTSSTGRRGSPRSAASRTCRTSCRSPPGLSPAVGVTEIKTNISAAGSYQQNWLPLPYPATKVRDRRALAVRARRAGPWSATAARPPAARSTRSPACW